MTDKQSNWLKLLVLGAVLVALFGVTSMWKKHSVVPPENVPANEPD
jgi:hypothetical protein